MAIDALTVLASSLSIMFAAMIAYLLLTAGGELEKNWQMTLATGLFLIPAYGIIEFGVFPHQPVYPLLVLVLAGFLLTWGINRRYREVVGW